MRTASLSQRGVSWHWSILAAVIVAFVLIPSGLVAASGPNGTLQGYVTDHANGAAIPGALVKISASDLPGTLQATTDSSGYYALSLPNHDYSVQVSAPAYSLNATSAGVGSGLTTWFNVSLNRASARSAGIQGFVKDSLTSAAVTVGRIVMTTPSWYYNPPYTNASSLNATGYYRMNLVPGTYILSTDGVTGYIPYGYSYLYPSSGPVMWYNITLTPLNRVYWINGTVEDSSNYTPIVGASVTASLNGQPFASTTSNATGRYSIHSPLGTIVLAGDAARYAPGTVTVYAYNPGQTTVNVYLMPLTSAIRGRVVNGVTGAGIPNALVEVSPYWGSGYYDRALTSAAGAYAVPVPVDYYSVAASAPGFAPWGTSAFFYSTGVDWVNVTLWPIVSPVKGYVIDGGTGLRLPNEYVYGYDSRAGYGASATTDTSGFYSFTLTPSPAITVRVYGSSPYAGAILYITTPPFVTTWLNITLPRLNAQVVANVTDATTGLPISGAAVSMSWGFGSNYAVTAASGLGTVPVPAGLALSAYAWATGYLPWYGTIPAVSTSTSISIQLYPSLNTNVTVEGYARNSLTSAGLSSVYVRATGYGSSSPSTYTNSTGYYTFAMMPAAQTILATYYGFTAGKALVNPAAGSTIWVNLSLTPDSAAPQITNFTATPAVNVGPGNPTTLSADINETSLSTVHLSVLMQVASTQGNGTFLNLGTLPDANVSVTGTGPHTYSVNSSWDTRMPVVRLSDGPSSAWWPVTPYGPFQVEVWGYWANATLTTPTYAAAILDARSGGLLYVATSYGIFGPQDQPTSTFTPYAIGFKVNLASSTILGTLVVTGPAFHPNTLTATVVKAVPGGSYGALLEAWDSGSNYGRAVTLLQVVADTVPPVARAGSDQAVNQGATVTLDGSASTDNIGIASYTWTFADGGAKVLHGAIAAYVFRNAGRFTVTLTVTDSAGNTGTSTMTVTVRDTTPPTITITAPADAANVSGSITVSATAADNLGVARVEFRVDGNLVGNVTSAPFQLSLNTATLSNGAHTVTATAYDAAGNSATAVDHVTVLNAAGAGGSLLGLDIAIWLGLLVVVAVAAIGIVLIVLRRRRPRAPMNLPPNPPPVN